MWPSRSVSSFGYQSANNSKDCGCESQRNVFVEKNADCETQDTDFIQLEFGSLRLFRKLVQQKFCRDFSCNFSLQITTNHDNENIYI